MEVKLHEKMHGRLAHDSCVVLLGSRERGIGTEQEIGGKIGQEIGEEEIGGDRAGEDFLFLIGACFLIGGDCLVFAGGGCFTSCRGTETTFHWSD